jgi:hypothetical protein
VCERIKCFYTLPIELYFPKEATGLEPIS